MEWRDWSVLIVDVAGMWLRHPRKLVPHFTDAGSMQCRSTVTANGSGLPGYHHGHTTASKHTDQNTLHTRTTFPQATTHTPTTQHSPRSRRDEETKTKDTTDAPTHIKMSFTQHLRQQRTQRERDRDRERAIVRSTAAETTTQAIRDGTGRDGGK